MTQDLRHLDLNLLRQLGDLLETAHVTRAAERAGIAQPAMSRALAKLRKLFGDPLLVPVGRALELSPRARALRPRVEDMLAAMRKVLEDPEAFEPARATGLVRVAANEYTVGPALKQWMLGLRARAPNLSVHVVSAELRSLSALAEGELDFVIGPAPASTAGAGIERFVVRPFVDATPACVLRQGHPYLKKRWDLISFCRAEHVIVATARPGPSAIDEALGRHDRQRRIALAVPSVGAALSLVASSDLVAVLPLAHLADYGLPLATRPLPFDATDKATYVVWSPRQTHDLRHRWLRTQLLGMASPRAR